MSTVSTSVPSIACLLDYLENLWKKQCSQPDDIEVDPYHVFQPCPLIQSQSSTDQLLNELDKLSFRKYLRVTIIGDESLLRIRMLMPNPHEVVRTSFSNYLFHAASQISFDLIGDDLRIIGAARQHWQNNVKEPDYSLYPAARMNKCPSLVVEIGYPETLPQLQRDAKEWLNRKPLEVLTVIVFKIFKSGRVLRYEKWKRVVSPNSTNPQAVESWECDMSSLPTVPAIVLTRDDLFDTNQAPPYLTGNITIPSVSVAKVVRHGLREIN